MSEAVVAKAMLDYVDAGENDGFFSPLDVLIIQNMRAKIEADYAQFLRPDVVTGSRA